MRTDHARSPVGWRRLVHALVVVLGITAIVGSGGGGFPDLNFNFDGPFAPSFATIEPSRATVQVGATVTFTVHANGTEPFSFQWARNDANIPGATAATYALAGANLADDGAQFSAKVSNSVGAATAWSLLHVSSLPGVAYRDDDFAVSDWAVSAIADPATNGPTHTESQSATGGNPGAFRLIAYQVPQGSSSIRVFNTSLPSVYNPAEQGAIYTIDFARDCSAAATSTLGAISASPGFQQGSRWFVGRPGVWACGGTNWQTRLASSLRADEFGLAAGPACSVNEACPDFSAGAAPLRFGFVSEAAVAPGATAGAITQGVDNWTVTVWRR